MTKMLSCSHYDTQIDSNQAGKQSHKSKEADVSVVDQERKLVSTLHQSAALADFVYESKACLMHSHQETEYLILSVDSGLNSNHQKEHQFLKVVCLCNCCLSLTHGEVMWNHDFYY